MKHKHLKLNREAGFASIVVALTLVIVLALVTLGFAQLSRREQQNSLSKQLATQANYAAETGINDAVKALPAIKAALDANTQQSDQCISDTLLPDYKVGDTNKDVSYSCVLVDIKPPSLIYNGVSNNKSRYVTFNTDGGALNSFDISWGSASNRDTFPANLNQGFTPSAQWESDKKWPAVLQVSFTRLRNMDRDTGLIPNTFTAYLYPSINGNNVATYVTGGTQAPIVSGRCDKDVSQDYPCTATIAGIGGLAGESYLIHFVNYYDVSNISINNAKAVTTNAPLKFANGQAMIDVTAKSKNVLKRLQVRVPIEQTGRTSSYAVEAQGTCKRLTSYPTGSSSSVDRFDSPYSGTAGSDACDLTKQYVAPD